MGKKGKGSSSGAAKKAPKCTCDDSLFKCFCGNRPERPSRGHKWDPVKQEWGGKGHKQKGGSGQTSQVATAAKTTEKGKTTLAQWQKMPSSLLEDVCKKEKRPSPKFKCISKHGGFKFRVIVQDAKASKRGGDHDIILVPASGVPNEEQAKEEAALLALLHLTPSIPHERKLPEPYKTTWLNALQSQAQAQSKPKASDGNDKGVVKDNANGNKNTKAANKPQSGTGSKRSSASASSNLLNANTFASRGEQRKQKEEKKRERNAKIRRHEAVRQANRDVQVFMSAQVRKQIESLLRGDVDADLLRALTLEDDEDDGAEKKDSGGDGDGDDDDDVVKMYVIDRLNHEGFSKSQAKAGYSAVLKNPSVALTSSMTMNSDEDEYMDRFYEESLQWLCVHLNEDQLPEGFDPRGRTLSVIQSGSQGLKTAVKSSSDESQKDAVVPGAAKSIVRDLGVSLDEASCLAADDNVGQIKNTFWEALCQLNSIESTLFTSKLDLSGSEEESNREIAMEELEVLKAIFPEEDLAVSTFVDSRSDLIVTQLLIPIDSMADKSQVMCVHYYDGSYPSKYPKVFVTGGWGPKNAKSNGTALHSELIKFVSTLPNDGEPMVFEIFNHVQEMLQSGEEFNLDHEVSILPYLKGGEKFLSKTVKTKPPKREEQKSSGSQRKFKRPPNAFKSRPRTKSAFWGKLPKQTAPAVAFPTLRPLLENARKRLPAATARDEFLRVMKKADEGGGVLLVTGETGCGKTTQIPQFILEEAPAHEKIIVAQPRRLAATGVAGRVANERGEDRPGTGSVGYVVRGDSKMSDRCRLLFCTTGVLLRQLQSEGALDCITTIVIDEVHERHLDTDILLAILKATRPKHLRVVLMSATMDADRFAAYWGQNTPRMHIPGFTHPVEDFTLEDVLTLTGYIPPKNGKKKGRFGNSKNRPFQRKRTAWNDSELSDDDDGDHVEDPATDKKEKSADSSKTIMTPSIPIEELVKRVNNSDIDYDMLAILVDKLVQRKKRDDDGSILVFLPGAPEISRAKDTIMKITRGENVQILPLHGGLQPQDQNRVFDPSRYGVTKVILSTNVAETSITIPDCTIVVDTCKEKQSSYDPSNRMPLLVEKLASRDSLKQRRGRAGRVRPGCCYKLISRDTHSKLPQHGEPEITRCALDQTLLSLLFLGVEEGSGNFLSTLIDPPSEAAVNAAIYSLNKIGAIVSTNMGERQLVTLTPLGQHLAGIPAPPSVGKMLVMGTLLGCRSIALAVAAGLSVGKSPFLRIDHFSQHDDDSKEGYRNKLIIEERKTLFDTVGNSDHAMLAAVFTEWDSLAGGGGAKRQYLESLGISKHGMQDIKQLVKQLDGSLSSAGFRSTDNSDINGKSWRIIRSFIVGSLAPAQIARVHRASTKYAETAEGAVEKDGVAKELKFFTRGNIDDDEETKNIKKFYHGVPEERVFVHPSSANFKVGNYSCPWLVYYQLVRTSKAFMRDVTECSNYDLLLFGGNLEVVAADGLIIVDGYVRMSANARIAALIGGLRRKVDDLLSKKISNPSYDVVKSLEMKLIVKLLRTDGLGQ